MVAPEGTPHDEQPSFLASTSDEFLFAGFSFLVAFVVVALRFTGTPFEQVVILAVCASTGGLLTILGLVGRRDAKRRLT